MQGTRTAADRAMTLGVDWGRGDSTSCYVASVAMARAALATSGGVFAYLDEYERAVAMLAARRAVGFRPDAHYDNEPRVTETPKRPRVWLPVIQPEAKPLRDRKRLLARRRK